MELRYEDDQLKQVEEEQKMEQKKRLEVGEKYLSISLFDGALKLAAFPNKDKKSVNSPDFRSNGVAVWVSEKKPTPAVPELKTGGGVL